MEKNKILRRERLSFTSFLNSRVYSTIQYHTSKKVIVTESYLADIHAVRNVYMYPCMHSSSLNDSLPGQKLRNHKMAHIFVRPVRQMASNACPEGDIEKAPKKGKEKCVSNQHAICQNQGSKEIIRKQFTHSCTLKSTRPLLLSARTLASSRFRRFDLSSASIHAALSPKSRVSSLW